MTEGQSAMLTPRLDIARSNRSVVTLGKVQREALDELKDRIATGEMRFVHLDCPVCGGGSLSPVATRDRYGVACTTGVCTDCGLMQTNPYPDASSLDWFYANIFARLHRGTTSPSTARFEGRRGLAHEVVGWLRQNGVPASGLAVDVGCASGGFLQGLVDNGYTGIGLEIDADYAADARSRGLDVRLSTIAGLAEAGEAVLVSYVQVLEHIVGVNDELAALRARLSPGALVFIEVPGLTSVPTMYNKDVLRLLQLAHVWHFTPESLGNLMAKHGFETVAITPYVRGLFRVPLETPATPPMRIETIAQVRERIARLERARLLYWRTWAIKAKAVLKRVLGRSH
ncbi:class I SAM-dependent methyltransferase [Croceicoccus mobilis]|nr:class I SAM-dependent methyltransferase [Croceicoccus mobilis]